MSNRIKLSLLFILLVPCWVVAWKFGQDMPAYYKVARWLVEDKHDLIFAPDGELRWWYYSPAALILFEPMGWFDFATAKFLWIVVHTLGYVAFWVGLHRVFPFLKERSCHLGWILIFIISINPLHTNFQAQNISLLLAAALLWAEVFTRSQKNSMRMLGGMLSVFVASIKLFPFFIVLFYWITKPKEVRRGILMGLLFVAVVPFFYFGFSTAAGFYRDWISNLTVYHQIYSLKINPENLSLPSLLSRWLSETLSPEKVGIVSKGIVSFLGMVYFAYVWKNRKRTEDSFQHHLWALTWAMMALLNSSTRPDYFSFFIPAYCSLVELWQNRALSWFNRGLALLSVFLLAFTTEWMLRKELNNLVESWRVPALGMVLLCVALWAALRLKSSKSLQFQ